MDSNTHSTQPTRAARAAQPSQRPGRSAGLTELAEQGLPEDSAGLALLGAADQALAAEDLDQLTDTALDEELLALRRRLDCLEGQWRRRLAAVDARGAAGADQGQRAASTAGWLRQRLRLGSGAAHEAVRCARALFGGPSPRPPPR